MTINGRDEDVFVLVRGLTSWVQISWDEDLDSLNGANSVVVYRDLDGTYYSERTVRGVVETKTSTISGCFNAFKVSYKETWGDSTVMEFAADVKKMTSRP